MTKVMLLMLALSVPSIASAKDVYVTYWTTPAGATLIEDGQKTWGTTPFRIKYRVPPKAEKTKGCFLLHPMTVRWVSGAEATIEGLQACVAIGKEQQFQFARPTGVPGAEVDAQYAVNLQQLALMQQSVALAEESVYAQQIAQMQQNYALQQQVWAAQRTHLCSSRLVGRLIVTSCN